MKRAPTVLLLALVVNGISGCSERTQKKKPSPAARSWEEEGKSRPDSTVYEDQDFVLEATGLTVCDSAPPLAPKPGHRRVSVSVILTGRSSTALTIGPLQLSLQDSDGHRYRATLAGCRPTLKQQELKKDQRIEAEVAFDVPASANRFELYFEPFIVGRKPISAPVRVP